MGFTRKIQLISLLIVLLPLIFATAIVTYIARDELFAEAQSRLVAVREIKQRQIVSMFQDFSDNLQAVSAVIASQKSLDTLIDIDQTLQSLNKSLGFYDLFIIRDDGTVLYTVEKESDFGTNLRTGPLYGPIRFARHSIAILRRVHCTHISGLLLRDSSGPDGYLLLLSLSSLRLHYEPMPD